MASYLKQNGTGDRQLIKVAIVEYDKYDRLFLNQILEKAAEFTSAGSFATAEEALAQIPGLNPQLVFMDIRMPGVNGLECTRQLKALLPQLKIIVVTELLDVDSMDESLRAGGDNYLIKPFHVAQCLATLKFTLGGGIRWREKARSQPEILSLLTARESEVMVFLGKGFLYKEIGDKLGISCSTVHFHLHAIYQKLAVGNRTEAIIRWWESKIPDLAASIS